MKYLKSPVKRDIALDYLERYKDRLVPANELNSYLQSTHPDDFSLDDIRKALNALVFDGFIKSVLPGYYQITLKGIILRENGGYAAQAEENNIRANHIQFASGFDNQDTSLYPWILAICGLLLVLAILRCGFLFWHWNIPF
jgi:hypothetical protein